MPAQWRDRGEAGLTSGEGAAPVRWRVGRAELPLHHQDRCLVDNRLGLFGVFDGVGAYARSGEAAALAADTVAQRCALEITDPLLAIAAALQEADQLIGELGLGATTATVAWVRGAQLLYASVGDSRLYHQPRGGSMRQVSVDEGEGRMLFNALGSERLRALDEVVPQRGSLAVGSGDKVLLVTDGITGDHPPDLLSVSDLAAAVMGEDPQQGAQRLVQVARKHDDRSALVLFLE
ncbi:MAG: PP2C family protein-serine/threonine phosphatase [Candidatus Dormibacteria bacterium]